MGASAALKPLPPTRKRNYPANRKSRPSRLQPDLALAQSKRGLTDTEIAKAQGVNQSTVWRFMQRMAPERAGVELFKANRAEVLARLQAKSLKVTEKIIDGLEDGDFTALTPQQKTGLILALNAQHGTTFDKERLERGQSTSNQSIVSRLIDSEVKDLYAQPLVIGSSSAPKR